MTASSAEDLRDRIALALVKGAGRKTVHEAVRFAAQVQEPLRALFGCNVKALSGLPGAGSVALFECLERCDASAQERADRIVAFAGEQGLQFLLSDSVNYPAHLADALGNQAPPFLFYRGNEALFQEQGVAIVGTRKPSLEGREWAEKAARYVAAEGITVVSGGAQGIDMAAHEVALHSDGTTVLFLPEGLHCWDEPRSLETGLENGQAIVVSEWLPSSVWSTHQAMTRNRSIAACARITCVIEPGKTGGSRYTAEATLAQGKPVCYWGGACREGFLANTPGASPLGFRYGQLNTAALDAPWEQPAPTAEQGELFS